MDIKEFRQKYPEYNDMPDQALADSLYQKSYSDMDRKEFDAKFLGGTLNEQNPKQSWSLPQPIKEIGKGLVQQMPLAGMAIGGAVGGPPGAFLGGALGAGGRGLIQEGLGIRPPKAPMENWMEMGAEGANAASAEILGPYMALGGQPLFSPYAGGIAEKMATNKTMQAAQKMIEEGQPISPTVLNPGRVASAADRVIGNMWPNNAIMAGRRKQLFNLAQNIKNEFQQEVGISKTSKDLVDDLYDKWMEAAGGPHNLIPTPKTAEAIQKNMIVIPPNASAAKWDFWRSDVPTLLSREGQTTAQDVRDFLGALKVSSGKAFDRSARMNIRKALSEDLVSYDKESGSQVAQALSAATQESVFYHRLKPLNGLIKQSRVKPEGIGEVELFDPVKFVNAYNQVRPDWIADKKYSPNEIKVIDEFAAKMDALAPDIKKLAEYQKTRSASVLSPRGFVGGTLGSMPGVLTGAATAPWLVIPADIADYALSRSLMNPNGLLRKFLTTGFNPPVLSSKMATMKGLEYINDKLNEYGNQQP